MKNQGPFNLLHSRWAIPIISVLYDQKGAKFITLLKELNISRSVLTSTLHKLIEQKLAIRNPGHGHPLRPEYLLTDRGIRFGPFCKDMMLCIVEQHGYRLIQSKWAIQIIHLCSRGEIRFSELKSALTPITSRALSEELKALNSQGYVERRIIEGYPPMTSYRTARRSTPFIMVIEKYKGVLATFL